MKRLILMFIKDHGRKNGGPSVTEEHQGDAHHRQQSCGHAHIDDRLPENDCHNPQGNDRPKLVFRIEGDLNSPQNQKKVEKQQAHDAHKPPLLRKNRKGEVRVLLRQKMEPRLGSVQKPFAPGHP